MKSFIAFFCFFLFYQMVIAQIDQSKFLTYITNPKEKNLNFYLKDDKGNRISNFHNLRKILNKKNKKLVFATNGGMYNKDFNPQGLYIEAGILKKNIDTVKNAHGNFYMQPNGIFYLLKDGTPKICKTENFKITPFINYATQSGPMLLIDGIIHSKFNKGSKNINIRNGVGILPSGNLIFVMTKSKINFYDFATFFKEKGCKNALYLDGFVSKTYLPLKKWKQLEGNFGVIIAETKRL